MVLELWILEDLSDGPDGHHFVLGLLACWCEDPLTSGHAAYSPTQIDFRTMLKHTASRIIVLSVLAASDIVLTF